MTTSNIIFDKSKEYEDKLKILKYIDLENVCRICLNFVEDNNSESMELVQSLGCTQDGTEIIKSFDEVLQEFTGLEASKDSKVFPQQICLKCKNELTKSYLFRLKCQKTHNDLLKLNNTLNFSNSISSTFDLPVREQCQQTTTLSETNEMQKSIENLNFNDITELNESDWSTTTAGGGNDHHFLLPNDTHSIVPSRDTSTTTSNSEKNSSNDFLNNFSQKNSCDDFLNLNEFLVFENGLPNESLSRRDSGTGVTHHQMMETDFHKQFYSKHDNNNTINDDDDFIKEEISSTKSLNIAYEEFNCAYCEMVYTSESSLRRHLKEIHDRDELFICKLCNKTFRQPSSVTRHKKYVHLLSNEHGGKFKLCVICNAYFRNTVEYKKHLREHFAGKIELKNSGKFFSTNNIIKNNIKKDIICKICPASGKSSQEICDHIKNKDHHQNSKFILEPRTYDCPKLECRKQIGRHITFNIDRYSKSLIANCSRCDNSWKVDSGNIY